MVGVGPATVGGMAGAELLPDPSIIDCFGRKVLIMHGDSLCTGDSRYMEVRKSLRAPDFQQELLSKSLEERAAFARSTRHESMQRTSNLANDIMDVTPDEVIRAMQQHDVELMIHGHTHRPAIHHLEVNDQPAVRIVLGSWYKEGWVLHFDRSGYRLESIAMSGLN